jgi:hypothetical protein
MTIKDNWNKEPLIPHKAIIKVLCLVWAIIVAWMLVLEDDPTVILIVPAAVLALIYLFVRLTP